MEMTDFVDQFLKLKEKELEQRVWELWLVKYPYMTADTFVSYEEMLNTARQGETKEQKVINGIYVDQAFI